MKLKFVTALAAVAGLYVSVQVGAQPAAGGNVAGAIRDSSGAAIAGAQVEVRNPGAHFKESAFSDREGHFAVRAVPVGRCELLITATGFAPAAMRDVVVIADRETRLSLTLKVAPVRERIEVSESSEPAAEMRKADGAMLGRSRNVAEVAAEAPGVSLRSNGQYAAMPLLHGMGDERVKVVVDGAMAGNSCPNHMNPPLSYAAPVPEIQVRVVAGIAPVSLGGDSLGGTIAVESAPPVFAQADEKLHEEGYSTGFYRSNGRNYGGAMESWLAGERLAVGYSGWWSGNDDYSDGHGHTVTSTYAQSTGHRIVLGARSGSSLLTVQGEYRHTPYEGFVNQRMDIVRNASTALNLRWRRSLGPGAFELRVYGQNSFHTMNMGHDKPGFMTMWMPMNTHGRDVGYAVSYEAPLSERHTLRVGNELHRFRLDDIWPAVAGTAPTMGPNAFLDIADGRRLRVGTYGEVASNWNRQWSTLFGVRNDTVWTDAGPVQGYSSMYAADAAAFNAVRRAHTDSLADLTALARYAPNGVASFEFGYARKNRAPNLYERYAWSTSAMASGMIGWFGDAGFYVGNVALRPETGHTVSGTAAFRGAGARPWELKATPYLTYIADFVDVNRTGSMAYAMATLPVLQFANHAARIGGGDLSGKAVLWDDGGQRGILSGVGGWVRGTRTDSGAGLYQIMPLNLRLSFDEEWKGVAAGLGMEAVDRKSRLDPNRMEQATAGYTLLHLHAGYRRGFLAADAGAENLLNRCYQLPLGGLNLDNWAAGMRMNPILPVTGRGRSVHFSLTARF